MCCAELLKHKSSKAHSIITAISALREALTVLRGSGCQHSQSLTHARTHAHPAIPPRADIRHCHIIEIDIEQSAQSRPINAKMLRDMPQARKDPHKPSAAPKRPINAQNAAALPDFGLIQAAAADAATRPTRA
jgi:hypothetical protein